MKFIPFDKFIIESKISESELTSLLSEQIEPKINFRLSHYFSDKKLKPYEGTLENRTFRINRIIKHQNPFLPRIRGKFETKYGGGSKIQIKMRIKYSVLLFVLFCSLAPTLFFFSFRSESNNETTLSPELIISIIWFTIGYLFTYLFFNYERNKSKKFLFELFKSE
jgi:hypothetical protein